MEFAVRRRAALPGRVRVLRVRVLFLFLMLPLPLSVWRWGTIGVHRCGRRREARESADWEGYDAMWRARLDCWNQRQ